MSVRYFLLLVCCCCCSSASHPACMQLVASGYANLGPANASIQQPYQLFFESEQIIAQQLECVVRAFCISCSVGAVHFSHISYLACHLSSNKHRVRAFCISCSVGAVHFSHISYLACPLLKQTQGACLLHQL